MSIIITDVYARSPRLTGNNYRSESLTQNSRCFRPWNVPSGASTGEHEAVELRDGDESSFG